MKKLAILAVLAAIIAAYFVFDLGQFLTLEGIKQLVTQWEAFYADNPVMVIAGFFAAYVAVTAASLPGAAIMTLAAGALFGVVTGTILVSFASTLGATLAFLSSRYVLRDSIEAKFGNRLAEIPKGAPVVLCCASGTRSGMARMLLKKNGYAQVFNVGKWSNLLG